MANPYSDVSVFLIKFPLFSPFPSYPPPKCLATIFELGNLRRGQIKEIIEEEKRPLIYIGRAGGKRDLRE